MPSSPTRSTSKSTGPKRTPGSGAAPSLASFAVHRVFQPRLLFLVAAITFLAAAGPRLKTLLPDLADHPRFQFATSEIQFNEPPDWIPGDLLQQVIRRAGLPEHSSVLKPDWAVEISEAFEQHPWVSQVISVRSMNPQAVSVELEFRRPVAMVEVRTGLYPIDRESILLPPEDFAQRDTQRYCLIRNAQSTPQGTAGMEWGDLGVLGAAAVADALSQPSNDSSFPYWRKLGIAAIEIPRRTKAHVTAEDLLYELVTVNGSRIKWGRAPGVDHPGELSTAQKLGRLDRYLAQLDDGTGPYEIDIRHWREITYHPLAASDGNRVRR